MIEKDLTIINKFGVHTRAAAKLVAVASRFESKIDLTLNSHNANAKSIMGVITLGAQKGAIVHVRVEGNDEQEAFAALNELINNKFDEKE